MRVVGREAQPDLDAASRLARLADVAEGGAAAQPGDGRAGIGRQRPVEQLDRMVVVAEQPRPDMAAQRQRQRIEAVEREREPAQPLGLHVSRPCGSGESALVEALAVAVRGQRIGRRIARIERHGALEQRQRLARTDRPRRGRAGRARAARIRRRRGSRAACAARAAARLSCTCGAIVATTRADKLVLQLEQVGGLAGEAVAPDRRAALAVASSADSRTLSPARRTLPVSM